MIALLGLLATLTMQQDTIGLSPRARAMLDRFAPPTSGEVAVSIRFSESNVWVGEQVELVTAAWFPRDLRERLRRTPALRAPALRGLWSAPNTSGPMHAETRRINGRVYDLFIAHQILFPIEAGPIEAPPAMSLTRKAITVRPITITAVCTRSVRAIDHIPPNRV